MLLKNNLPVFSLRLFRTSLLCPLSCYDTLVTHGFLYTCFLKLAHFFYFPVLHDKAISLLQTLITCPPDTTVKECQVSSISNKYVICELRTWEGYR